MAVAVDLLQHAKAYYFNHNSIIFTMTTTTTLRICHVNVCDEYVVLDLRCTRSTIDLLERMVCQINEWNDFFLAWHNDRRGIGNLLTRGKMVKKYYVI